MFTEKTEEQLAWDLVKAMVRAKVYLEVAAYRNRRTNELLAELYPLFEASLAGEEVLTIDPEFDAWIRDALASIETRATIGSKCGWSRPVSARSLTSTSRTVP